ncbi:hypothetical protein CMV_017788 [Castanea mollissima]|uniref:Uncharacterized protein n=1 Tax=Castanea mollissima TaxID=60419 RepID=A0A8J4R3U9_9ROSI|nr:hypothetical protein CMV_017788 [Castanea mollissima]
MSLTTLTGQPRVRNRILKVAESLDFCWQRVYLRFLNCDGSHGASEILFLTKNRTEVGKHSVSAFSVDSWCNLSSMCAV